MGDYSLGSIATEVGNLVDDIPSTLSGTAMHPMINRQLNIVNRDAGVSIGSNAISLPYQEPLIMLTLSKMAMSIDLNGTDADTIRLGEFQIKKGSQSSAQAASKYYKQEATELINSLKGRYNYYKALG